MSQPWPVDDIPPLSNTPESDLASLSPRTSLLSSPDAHPAPLPGASRRVPRGPGQKFRHERERAHSSASHRDLMRLLVNEEYESRQTRKVLYTAFDRLEDESKRAAAAESRLEESMRSIRAINEARVVAQREAAQAQEELRLYKLQLDNAQREILRAQDVLKAIENQRNDAENAAAEARSRARKLNEERLVQLARDEGRRLGFEEGVRRGRKMGYREGLDDGRSEMRDAAATALDRLLDEEDQLETLENVTPVPPPPEPRTTPEVHRVDTPPGSSFEDQHNRSRRDSMDGVSRASATQRVRDPVVLPVIVPAPGSAASVPTAPSQASRPQQQPWPEPQPEPYSRPVSVQNSAPSVHHQGIHIPPDGYIPTADADSNISLPPPHELHPAIPSLEPSQPAAPPEGIRSRDYAYEQYPPPRRSSPDDSLASTKQSAASTISQLDLVGLPANARRRERPQGLSVIHEDVSVRSGQSGEPSGTVPGPSQAERRSYYRSERDSQSTETLGQRRDRKSKQRFADELRYSDPSEVEEWRRYGAERTRSQASSGGPPRQRPVHVTTPTPLSPPHMAQPIVSSERRRTNSMSQRQGRAEARPEDHRRPVSSDSSVPEINVEPPSGPPSDAPSRGREGIPPNAALLSPEHANRPLPVPAPGPSGRAPLVPTVPNSPVTHSTNLAGIYSVLPSGQLPPGFMSNSNSSSQGPVIPQNMGSAPPQRHASPYVLSQTDRESARSRSPIPIYAASPVPSGVAYPAPPISRSAAYNAQAPGRPSGSDDRRRNSLSDTAGMTPAVRSKPLHQSASSNARDSGVLRKQSNTSIGSQSRPYSRYDPHVYNDPAYLASNDSLMDPVTGNNTAANAAARPIRIPASPTYSYRTLRTNE